METVETNDTKGWIIGAIVLVVVVGGGWWMIKHGKASSSVIGKEASTTEAVTGDNYPVQDEGAVIKINTNAAVAHTTATIAASGEKVSVQDQAGGSSVAIASMNLTKASWVAIKDVKGILGAAWYPAGATSGTASLLRPTVKGGAYQAVVYVDDGDKKFDMHKDTLVTGVEASFTAK